MTVEIKTILSDNCKVIVRIKNLFEIIEENQFNGSLYLKEIPNGPIEVSTSWVYSGKGESPDRWYFDPITLKIESLGIDLSFFPHNQFMGKDGVIRDSSYSGSIHAATNGKLSSLTDFIGCFSTAFEACKKVREYLINEYIMDSLKPSLHFKEVEV